MSFTMGLNLLLLMAMVATNILFSLTTSPPPFRAPNKPHLSKAQSLTTFCTSSRPYAPPSTTSRATTHLHLLTHAPPLPPPNRPQISSSTLASPQ
ncbi:hypothetical protein M0R45_013536 [Rubus argutus]|uniref:Uncharacterized protein n=1 Tax=Rubus argutus TaxID=59490 RepID=A0AAW1XK28_RUBAR